MYTTAALRAARSVSYETNLSESATTATYAAIDRAFRHFNLTLFAGRLPDCIFVFHRKRGAFGYFWSDIWSERDGERTADEIALNPDALMCRTVEQSLSTLVHEMVHLEQQHFGKPSRAGYHNAEWAEMMDRVGLVPSSTGQPGGKRTGQRVSHYIAERGAFARAAAELVAEGFTIPWLALDTAAMKAAARKKAESKTKFTCAGCAQNAWAKPTASICCGDCGVQMVAA